MPKHSPARRQRQAKDLLEKLMRTGKVKDGFTKSLAQSPRLSAKQVAYVIGEEGKNGMAPNGTPCIAKRYDHVINPSGTREKSSLANYVEKDQYAGLKPSDIDVDLIVSVTQMNPALHAIVAKMAMSRQRELLDATFAHVSSSTEAFETLPMAVVMRDDYVRRMDEYRAAQLVSVDELEEETF